MALVLPRRLTTHCVFSLPAATVMGPKVTVHGPVAVVPPEPPPPPPPPAPPVPPVPPLPPPPEPPVPPPPLPPEPPPPPVPLAPLQPMVTSETARARAREPRRSMGASTSVRTDCTLDGAPRATR